MIHRFENETWSNAIENGQSTLQNIWPETTQIRQTHNHYELYHLGAKFWYFPLYYSFAFVIYVGYLLIKTAAVRLFNFIPGLQQSLNE